MEQTPCLLFPSTFTLSNKVRTKSYRYDLEGFQITTFLVCYNLFQYLLYLLALQSESAEWLWIITLNSKYKIVRVNIIGDDTDTIDRIYIEPRQVYIAEMLNNAKTLIFFRGRYSSKGWQNRLLHSIYVVVFMDAIHAIMSNSIKPQVLVV